MNAARKIVRRRGPGRALLRLHRRIGIGFAAIFIAVCITGILLNHNDDLPFQERVIEADWIYDWYGLQPEGGVQYFNIHPEGFSVLDGQAYLGRKSLGYFPHFVGVASLPHLIAIAESKRITLLTPAGELLEKLPATSIPGESIRAIAPHRDGSLVIDTESGRFQSDQDILEWKPATAADSLSPHASAPAPKELEATLLKAYRGEGITWGRLLLDLHTGRFFGSIGKWLVDISAIALIFLTLSGVVYTLRYLKKARERASNSRA